MELTLSLSRLRPWKKGDEASLIHNANNRKVAQNLRDHFPHPYTRVDAEEWITLCLANQDRPNVAIEVNGEAVGGIGLILDEDDPGLAEIGYWLGESYWGKGIVSEAVVAITKYGLEDLGLKRIYAAIFPWNRNSMRVLEKAGYHFTEIATKPEVKAGKAVFGHVYEIRA